MVPLYDRATTLSHLFHKVPAGNFELKLTAIDNLPSILPFESSVDFSSQLISHVLNFSSEEIALKNTKREFDNTMARL